MRNHCVLLHQEQMLFAHVVHMFIVVLLGSDLVAGLAAQM